MIGRKVRPGTANGINTLAASPGVSSGTRTVRKRVRTKRCPGKPAVS